MDNEVAPITRKNNRVSVISFLIFFGFILIAIRSFYDGIAHHQTWRIVAASIGGVIFIAFIIISLYINIKNSKNANHK